MKKILKELPPSMERTVLRLLLALREERGILLSSKEVETLFHIRDLEEISKDLQVLEENLP